MQNPPISFSFAGSSSSGASLSGATEQGGGSRIGNQSYGAGSLVNIPAEHRNAAAIWFAAIFAVGFFAFKFLKK